MNKDKGDVTASKGSYATAITFVSSLTIAFLPQVSSIFPDSSSHDVVRAYIFLSSIVVGGVYLYFIRPLRSSTKKSWLIVLMSLLVISSLLYSKERDRHTVTLSYGKDPNANSSSPLEDRVIIGTECSRLGRIFIQSIQADTGGDCSDLQSLKDGRILQLASSDPSFPANIWSPASIEKNRFNLTLLFIFICSISTLIICIISEYFGGNLLP
jgi:hypothetical protein